MITSHLDFTSGRNLSSIKSCFTCYLAGLLSALFLAGCASAKSNPLSAYNKNWFQEPPVIVIERSGYSFQWIYGSMGFYFLSKGTLLNEDLVFHLVGTTSTGSKRGERGTMAITDPAHITAIEQGRVYWREPDGSLLKLQILDHKQ